MKIGFNMFLSGPAISVTHRSAFEALKATGYDGVEIPVIAGHLEDYRALAAMLDEVAKMAKTDPQFDISLDHMHARSDH